MEIRGNTQNQHTSLASDKIYYINSPKQADPRLDSRHPSFRAFEMASRLMKDRVVVEKCQSEAAKKIQQWRKNNPEKARNNYLRDAHRHRAKQFNLAGNFTMAEFYALCKKYDNKCLCCGMNEPLTVDHVIPISMEGSTNDISNIQPLCFTCNTVKGNEYIDFRPETAGDFSKGFQSRLQEQKSQKI